MSSPTTAESFSSRMKPADAILWRIEHDPVLRSTVTSVLLLDRAPDFDLLAARLAAMADEIPRLRQRVVEGRFGALPEWVDVGDLDLRYHLAHVVAPAPGTFASALDLAANQAMGGFDRTRPLWQFTVIDGLEHGRAALVTKFHHSVTDGVGGIAILQALLDTTRRPARIDPRAPVVHPAADTRSRSAVAVATDQATQALHGLAAGTRKVAGASMHLASASIRASVRPFAAAREASLKAKWAVRLVRPVSEPLSPIMLGRSTSLRFAAFDVDLAALRDAAHQHGRSLNDAFLCAVGGGLQRYHSKHGRRVDALRMTLPINIRHRGDESGGNRFVPVRFAVPVGIDDPVERMAAISDLVREWRSGPALDLTDSLATLLAELPEQAVAQVFGGMLRNVDFVATNVPGIPVTVFVAGSEILRQYAFAPPSGSSLNVALMTYAGKCCIGLNIDPAAVPDWEVMVGCVREGFDEVIGLAAHAETEPTKARRAS